MTAKHQSYVGIAQHDFIEILISDYGAVAVRVQKLVKHQKRNAIGILLEHAVHPIYIFLRGGAVAHIQKQHIDAVCRKKIVMTLIILVIPAVPRIFVVAGFSEI